VVSLSDAERKARARMGGQTVAAKGTVNTATARAAFWQKFLDQVDPERALSAKERIKRATAARALFYERLRFKALKARRLKREAAEKAES